MKRLNLVLSLLPVSLLLSGCGGGQSSFRPPLVGSWRVRSFSVDNGTPVDCPSNLSAGSFFDSCTAQSLFTFRADGTVLDPNLNLRTYRREALTVYYNSPTPLTTQIEFDGSDNVVTWKSPATDVLPAVTIIMDRIQ